MRLIKLFLTSVLTLACFSLGAAVVPYVEGTPYDRLIIISKQNFPYIAANPLDPDHAFMRSTGIYTEAQIDQLDAEAIADLYVQYGVDMSDNNPSVIFNPVTGIRILPGVAVMLPVSFGTTNDQPWIVTSDTRNPNREFKWLHYQFASLTQFLSGFVVPAGATQAGATVIPGDIFFRASFVDAKMGADWSNPENYEKYETRCTILSVQNANIWGLIEYFLSYDVYDRYNRKGFVSSSTPYINEPAVLTGQPHTNGRLVFSWIYNDEQRHCDQGHCHAE